jgi:hypothetical protein
LQHGQGWLSMFRLVGTWSFGDWSVNSGGSRRSTGCRPAQKFCTAGFLPRRIGRA